MADIILLDGKGDPKTYSGVNTVEFDTTDGNRVQYHEGVRVTKSVDVDFSQGDQVISIPEKNIVTEITIEKPDDLLPENIRENINIGGVVGTLKETSSPEGPGGTETLDSFIDGSATEVITNAAKIRGYAFYYNETVERIIAPNAEFVGGNAFQYCENLKVLHLPSVKNMITPGTDTPNLEEVRLGETRQGVNLPSMKNAYSVPMSALRDWQLYQSSVPFKQYSDTNVMRHVCNSATATSLTLSIYAEAGETIVAVIATRSSLTLQDGWTLLRESPPYGSSNQRLSFAYIDVTETGDKSYTFAQASSGRIYVNLIALKNVKSLTYTPDKYFSQRGYLYDNTYYTKEAGEKLIWGLSASAWSSVSAYWETYPKDCTIVQQYSTNQPRVGAILDFGDTTSRQIHAAVDPSGEPGAADSGSSGVQIDAIEVEFNEEE